MFSFRVVNPDDTADMEAFHYWLNDKCVNEWWSEHGDLAKHRADIQRALDDPAVLPLVMSWDGERMRYCEMFWLKENYLAPYIPNGAHDCDCGVHLLVGEEELRGSAHCLSTSSFTFSSGPHMERFRSGVTLRCFKSAGASPCEHWPWWRILSFLRRFAPS
ncbi:hypothetical protein ACEPAI_1413 [Sanghuangporus weigelae]